MATENDILGISGHLDISDIVNSIKELYNEVGKVENLSKDMAMRMQRAFQDVANASEKEIEGKAKSAIGVFMQAFEEAKNSAEKNVSKIESTISRLQTQLSNLSVQRSETVIGTRTYDELSRQIESLNTRIHNQQALLSEAKLNLASVGDMYSHFTGEVATANSALDAFNSVRSIATGATAANATAHLAVTAAVGAESTAHAKNTEEINKEKDSVVEGTEKVEQYTETLKEEIPVVEELNQRIQRLKELNADLDLRIGDFEGDEKILAQMKNEYEQREENIKQLEKQRDELLYGVEESEKLNLSEERRAEIEEAIVNNQKQALANYEEMPSVIEGIKEKINEVEETAENADLLKKMWGDITTLEQNVKSPEDLLTQGGQGGLSSLNTTYERLIDDASKLDTIIKKQKESTDEVKNATSGVEKEASYLVKTWERFKNGVKDTNKSVKQLFTSFKSGFSAGGGGLGSMFSLLMSGKFLGAAAAIGAAGGSIKYLSGQAESLRQALKGLKPYVDDDTIGKLRESLIDTALQGSAQSTEDMAAAAVKWMKSYDGLNGNVKGIQTLINASRELATITDTSAEKAADSLTKLAGQFGLTANEAVDSVNAIVTATKNSNSTYQEMITALTNGGQKAKLNGASFKEYAAAVSYASIQFGGAGKAASAYQMTLQALSKEAKKEFNPSQVGAAKALKNLNEAMKNGEDISQKFGKRIWKNAQYFVNNSEKIADYTDKISNAADKVAALQSKEDRAAEAKQRLENASAALAQEIDLNLTPGYARLLTKLTNVVAKLGELIGGTEKQPSVLTKLYNKADKVVGGIVDFFGGKGYYDKFNQTIAPYNPMSYERNDYKKSYEKVYAANNGDEGKAMDAWLKQMNQKRPTTPIHFSTEELKGIAEEVNKEKKEAAESLSNVSLKNNNKENETTPDIRDKGADKKATEEAKKNEDLAKLRRKQEKEEQKQRLDALRAMENAIIAEEQNDAIRERMQAEQDHKLRLDQIEEHRQQMLEKNTEYAAAEYNKNKGKKDAGFYAQGLDKKVTLTADQQAEIDAMLKEEEANEARRLKKENQERLQSMRDYLKEYGTFQQQKLAIAEEYAEKIRQAEASGNKGEAMRLRAEQEKATGDAKARELARGIDFTQMLDGVGVVVQEIAKKTYEEVQKYKKTDEYKNSSAESKKAIADLEARLIDKGGAGFASPFSGKTWDDIHEASERLRKAFDELTEKNKEHEKALEEEKVARENLALAEKNLKEGKGSYVAVNLAKAQVNNAESKVTTTGTELKKAEGEAEDAQNDVNNAAIRAAKGLQTFRDVLGEITSGTLSGFASGLFDAIGLLTGKIDKAGDGMVKILGEKTGGIIGAILSIIDALGDDAGETIKGIIDGVFGAITGIIDQLFSGELLEKLGQALVDGITSLIDSLTFGLFGLNDDEEEKALKEREERLEIISNQLEAMEYSMNKLTEALEKSYGIQAIKEAKEAKNLLSKQQSSMVQGMKDSLGGYEYQWTRDNATAANIIAKKLGISGVDGGPISSAVWWIQLMHADPQKLAEILEELRKDPILWSQMTSWGNGLNQKEWLENLANSASKGEEIDKALSQQLTQTTYQDIEDSYFDMLMNMEEGTEDWANNISKIMASALIKNFIFDEEWQNRQKDWLERYKTAMEKDDREELKRLKQEQEEWFKEDKEKAKAFQEYVGYNSSSYEQQTASRNSIENISYDQADSLVGISTAQQIVMEQILSDAIAKNEVMAQINTSTLEMKDRVRDISEGVTLIHEAQNTINNHLADISRNTHVLPEMSDELRRLRKIVEEN